MNHIELTSDASDGDNFAFHHIVDVEEFVPQSSRHNVFPISAKRSLLHWELLQMDGLDLRVALAVNLLRRTNFKVILCSGGHSYSVRIRLLTGHLKERYGVIQTGGHHDLSRRMELDCGQLTFAWTLTVHIQAPLYLTAKEKDLQNN